MNKWLILTLMLAWLAWHFAVPNDLTSSDLGRHIKNGELLLQGHTDVLYKNYYSYTHPDHPFINHHWLFGVLAFLAWQPFGFEGLSLWFIALLLATFLVFFGLAWRMSSFYLASALALLTFPILATRPEIRPEGFSFLISGLFYLCLHLFTEGRLKGVHLILILAGLQGLWVNIHLFFPVGFILVGLFLLQSFWQGKKDDTQILSCALLAIFAACFLNPSGIGGAFLPFDVFKGLPYRIMEQQPLWYLYKIHFSNAAYYYLPILTIFFMVPWFVVLRREGIKKHAAMVCLLVILIIASVKVVRFVGLLGYFGVPLSAFAWHRCFQYWPEVIRKRFIAAFLIAGIVISATVNFNVRKAPILGIKPQVQAAAAFFKNEGLSGPIFNNFDIGGYLIFHLAPQQKLFMDNRPEAFPEDFFRKTVVPMQMDEAIWQQVDAAYRFNTIFFNRLWWGQKFIFRRFNDPNWVPVFIDETIIILVRNSPANSALIERFRLNVERTISPTGEEGFRLDRRP